ncbi:hypothetical protein RFI_09776, partial [Reticulomyxa filosa]
YLGPPSHPPGSLVINGIGGAPLSFNSTSSSLTNMTSRPNGSNQLSAFLPQSNIIQMGRRILDNEDDGDDENENENDNDNGENAVVESTGMESNTREKKNYTSPLNTTNSIKKLDNQVKIVFESPQQVSAILGCIQFRAVNRRDDFRCYVLLFDHNEYHFNNKKLWTKNKSCENYETSNSNNMKYFNMSDHHTNNNNNVVGSICSSDHESQGNQKNCLLNVCPQTAHMWNYRYVCSKMKDSSIQCNAKIIVTADQSYEINIVSLNPLFNKGISRILIKGTHNHKSIF